AAKDAIRTVWRNHCGEKLFLADIEIAPDLYGRPVGRLRDPNSCQILPAVSIAHTDGVAVALAAFETYIGIDIENVKPREKSFEEIAFDEEERELLNQFGQK